MAQVNNQATNFRVHDFPISLSVLLVLLFLLSWLLALSEWTALKPVHFTLFNFLLVSFFALQKYRRLDLNAQTQRFRLMSIGLLTGRQVVEGDLSEIGRVQVEPGLGGIRGRGGRLMLSIKDRPPLIVSNTDIRPGSHQALIRIGAQMTQWLEQHRRA